MADYVDPRIMRPVSRRLTGEALEALNSEEGGGSTEVSSEDITDASAVGKSVLTAVDAAAVRTLIGAASLSVATASLDGLMSLEDKTKLDGISSGATANATNAQLRDRATHTGTQAVSTIVGLQDTLTTLQNGLNDIPNTYVPLADYNALVSRVEALEAAQEPVGD